jgi:tRNA(Ser,Leu) C12 N-acetylase TAN1
MPLTSFYSIVRYVPDLVRDEGINIGVVLEVGVNGQRSVAHHFTENFQRAAKIDPFLGTVILERNVKNAIEQIKEELEDKTLKRVIEIHGSGKIQFSQPRLTLVDHDSIQQEINELYEQFVWEERESKKLGVTETKLRQKVIKTLLHEGINGERVRVSRPSEPIEVKGRRFNHSFDMSVQFNGHPDFIKCISFDVENHLMKRDIAKALTFDAQDIHAGDSDVRVMSVLYPPTKQIKEREPSFLEALAILADQKIPAFNFAAERERDRLLHTLKK